MRSKKTVLLVLLVWTFGAIVLGGTWRIIHPDKRQSALADVPVYPGAREVEPQQSDATPDESFVLPPGATHARVMSFLTTHLPKEWHRVNASCFARGGTRLVIATGTQTLNVYVRDTC